MDTSNLTLELSKHPVSDAERQALLADPGFGRLHSDHMVTVRWAEHKGWYDGRLQPYANFSFDPATSFLHYGQAIFEGMKAYKLADGSVAMFRPHENAQRFQRSAARMALPELPVELFIEACEALVRTDAAWIPESEGASLYLRPFLLGTEVGLGVRPSNEALFALIAMPAANYFAGPVRPLTLWLSTDISRAAPGGTGEAKCAGNYAASLLAQQASVVAGCDQVAFLDAVEHRWIEELGGMNLFFVLDDGSLITPELSGTILRGVTRDSLITLARDAGHEVTERKIDIAEWRDGVASGRVREVFACGTAAVLTPIGTLRWEGGEVSTGTEIGPVTQHLRAALVDLQYGRTPDPRGWRHEVLPAP
ncbi:MAG TPA: branched-chain amino acid aminotransferase [Mycobacteriales bacterium]|nr:branched-chain amino acid aminotransferase [Mycobacteriales bacterium]